MGMIKAIGFDYSGVIGGYKPNGLGVMDETSQILGIDRNILSQTYFSINHLVNTGIKTWEEFLPLMLQKLGKMDKLSEVKKLHTRVGLAQTNIDQNMVRLVDALREKGYKVGLLSNNTPETGEKLRKLGLADHFDIFMISAEQGLQKPDPRIFQLFAKQLGVNLTELVFIDDAKMSLSTAKTCGYTPILYKSYDQLVAELTKLKVL